MNNFQTTDRMSHINLHYIRAAVEENTGVTGLSLEQIRDYLVLEGLIPKGKAKKYAPIFTGYSDFFDEIASVEDRQEYLDDEY